MTRKYRNVPVEIDGIRFDSKREASHYGLLKILQKAGHIRELTVHPKYDLAVNGVKVGYIKPDFRFVCGHSGDLKFQDTKGIVTTVWKLKAKMFKAQYGHDIEVVK